MTDVAAIIKKRAQYSNRESFIEAVVEGCIQVLQEEQTNNPNRKVTANTVARKLDQLAKQHPADEDFKYAGRIDTRTLKSAVDLLLQGKHVRASSAARRNIRTGAHVSPRLFERPKGLDIGQFSR